MSTNDYRAEAEKLRSQAGFAVTADAKRHFLDLAAIFEMLANADDALTRAQRLSYRR